jgi:hypothetical protein
MDLADDGVVGAGGVAVEVEAAVAGAEVVAKEPELSLGGMSQTWGWPDGQKICGDRCDQARAENTDCLWRHGTLRNDRLGHGDPGG